jgi:hypothetical protein
MGQIGRWSLALELAIAAAKVGVGLARIERDAAAGDRRDHPDLEGFKLDGDWAGIGNKFDLGCALDHHEPIECTGYNHERALRIAANVVIHATLF